MGSTNATKEGWESGARRRSITRIASTCIILAIAASSAYVFYDLNGDSFNLSDRQILLIVTDSMDGDVNGYQVRSFPADTMVMIRHLSEEEKTQIQVGDVLSFRQGGILNHHRVVDVSGIESGHVITKGDNTSSTETVKLSDINGEVIGTNHWLGAVTVFVKEYFILLALAGIFLYVSYRVLKWALRPEESEPKEV